MLKSGFEYFQIFMELFLFEILKNQLPAINDSRELKKPSATHILYTFKMFLVSSALHA